MRKNTVWFTRLDQDHLAINYIFQDNASTREWGEWGGVALGGVEKLVARLVTNLAIVSLYGRFFTGVCYQAACDDWYFLVCLSY